MDAGGAENVKHTARSNLLCVPCSQIGAKNILLVSQRGM